MNACLFLQEAISEAKAIGDQFYSNIDIWTGTQGNLAEDIPVSARVMHQLVSIRENFLTDG